MNDIPFQTPSNADPKSHPDADCDRMQSHNQTWHPHRTEKHQLQPNIKLLMPWVQQLPPEVRPRQLIIQYARIAQKLAELWRHPIACEKYFNELMLDGRGNRQGFPQDVAQELAALQVYFNTHVITPHYSIWGDRIGQ